MTYSEKSDKDGRDSDSDPFFEKPLPHAVSMEKAVLGAVELEPGLCNEMELLLKREDFFLDSHRRIYDKMIALKAAQQPIDLLTLREALRAAGEFEQVGGATYLSSLIDGLPRTDTIEPYARVIKTRARARRLITAANQIIANTFDDPDDPELLSKSEGMIAAIAADETEKAEAFPMVRFAQEYIDDADRARERGDRITGISTGFHQFDTMTLGLQRQELTIIAARVSQGKTTLALNMGHNIVREAQDNYRVILWSGEMPGKRIAGKSIAKQAHIDSFRMRSGEYDDEKVAEAMRTFAEWGDRFTICDKPGIDVMEFRALCRRQKMRRGLDVAIADYLLLFRIPPNIRDRRLAIGDNAMMLKNLARELDISVVLLHQLSRAPESRSDQEQEPKIIDLAESGLVEHHADVIAFLWRSRKKGKIEEGITNCSIAKQRIGPTGSFGLAYIKEQDRIENLADDQELPFNSAARGY